jgi:integrase
VRNYDPAPGPQCRGLFSGSEVKMTTKIGIYRSGKKWRVRWFGKYNPATGRPKRYSKTFKRRIDAENFAAQKTVEFQKGDKRDKLNNITLRSFCQNWLRAKQAKPKTLKLYEETIDRLLSYFGESMLLKNLSQHRAEMFIAELKPRRGRTFSDWTRHRALRNSRCIFKKAVEWDYLAKNPFSKVTVPKGQTAPWYYINPKEYSQLIDKASTQWKAICALLYTAGLRFGEAFSRTWSDIDFETGILKIDNRVKGALPPFHIKNNGKPRTIQLPQDTLDILTKWQSEQPERIPYILLNERQYKNALKRWEKYKQEGRQWENTDIVNNVNRDFQRLVKKADIQPVGTLSIHTLRKCAGKNWAMVNRDPKVTQRLMGHKTITTTLEYYDQVTPDDLAMAAQKIEKLLNPEPEKTDQKLTISGDIEQN